ncbi:MAG: DUF131 domain-containing protein [Conexivisphaerales archaeon]
MLFELGFLIVIIGMLLLFLATMIGSAKKSAQGGAVLLIGPIPIIFGSDKRWAMAMMIIALAIIVIWLVTVILG